MEDDLLEPIDLDTIDTAENKLLGSTETSTGIEIANLEGDEELTPEETKATTDYNAVEQTNNIPTIDEENKAYNIKLAKLNASLGFKKQSLEEIASEELASLPWYKKFALGVGVAGLNFYDEVALGLPEIIGKNHAGKESEAFLNALDKEYPLVANGSATLGIIVGAIPKALIKGAFALFGKSASKEIIGAVVKYGLPSKGLEYVTGGIGKALRVTAESGVVKKTATIGIAGATVGGLYGVASTNTNEGSNVNMVTALNNAKQGALYGAGLGIGINATVGTFKLLGKGFGIASGFSTSTPQGRKKILNNPAQAQALENKEVIALGKQAVDDNAVLSALNTFDDAGNVTPESRASIVNFFKERGVKKQTNGLFSSKLTESVNPTELADAYITQVNEINKAQLKAQSSAVNKGATKNKAGAYEQQPTDIGFFDSSDKHVESLVNRETALKNTSAPKTFNTKIKSGVTNNLLNEVNESLIGSDPEARKALDLINMYDNLTGTTKTKGQDLVLKKLTDRFNKKAKQAKLRLNEDAHILNSAKRQVRTFKNNISTEITQHNNKYQKDLTSLEKATIQVKEKLSIQKQTVGKRQVVKGFDDKINNLKKQRLKLKEKGADKALMAKINNKIEKLSLEKQSRNIKLTNKANKRITKLEGKLKKLEGKKTLVKQEYNKQITNLKNERNKRVRKKTNDISKQQKSYRELKSKIDTNSTAYKNVKGALKDKDFNRARELAGKNKKLLEYVDLDEKFTRNYEKLTSQVGEESITAYRAIKEQLSKVKTLEELIQISDVLSSPAISTSKTGVTSGSKTLSVIKAMKNKVDREIEKQLITAYKTTGDKAYLQNIVSRRLKWIGLETYLAKLRALGASDDIIKQARAGNTAGLPNKATLPFLAILQKLKTSRLPSKTKALRRAYSTDAIVKNVKKNALQSTVSNTAKIHDQEAVGLMLLISGRLSKKAVEEGRDDDKRSDEEKAKEELDNLTENLLDVDLSDATEAMDEINGVGFHINEKDAVAFIDNYSKDIGNHFKEYEGSFMTDTVASTGETIERSLKYLSPKDKLQAVNVMDRPYRSLAVILNDDSVELTDGAVIALRASYPSVALNVAKTLGVNANSYELNKYIKIKKLIT